jgi:glucose/arabinose dehydrogenase
VAAGGETILLDLPTLSATNHNGGALHFGPDGKLYVAVGENAVGPNAQSFNTPLGKLLRINPDGSIPGDNPM